MSPRDFVIWLKGFTEACPEFHPTPKQWDRLKEVLEEVEDPDLNLDLDFEEDPDDCDDWYQQNAKDQFPLSGSITVTNNPIITITSGSNTTHINATVWNDKMGCWHYTNYPEGFGYYFTNSTLTQTTPENTKKQLLD